MTELLLKLSVHDERALHALVARRTPRLDRALRAVTHLGGATATVALTAVLLLCAVPALVAAGGLAAFALASSHALVQIIKRRVNRPRPRLPVGLESLVRAPDRFSFPSGHSAASLSVALPLALALGTAVGLLIAGVAVVIGVSRCYLGVHYPGDVLAGWLLALLGLGAGVLVGL